MQYELMADFISKERRSEIMRSIRSSNTKPELLVRSILHRLGYRFRLHQKNRPGCPDIVLPRHGVVIFVHGCFWHGCTKCDKGTRIPKTNTDFWREKIGRNRERDRQAIANLKSTSWPVMIVWQCETSDVQKLASKLQAFLSSR